MEDFASSRLRGFASAPPLGVAWPTGASDTGISDTGISEGRDPRGHPESTADYRDRCDLCAGPLPVEHRHLLDVPAGALSCACRTCGLLFDRQNSGGSHYRLLPRRRIRLDGPAIDDLLWAGLGVPVDLAFFVRAGASGEITAGYPSPLGTLRSTVEPPTWGALEKALPSVARLADDVEALLVNRAGGAREQWLVPLDDCYRLVALVRAHWKGLGGGAAVWEHVEAFFAQLSAGPRPVSEKVTTWPTSP